MQGVLFAFFSVLFCFLSKNSHETIVSSHCLFPVLLGLAEMLGPHSAAVSNSHPQKAQVALGQALPHVGSAEGADTRKEGHCQTPLRESGFHSAWPGSEIFSLPTFLSGNT